MFSQFKEYSQENGEDFSIKLASLHFHNADTEIRFRRAYFQSNLQLGRACHLIAIFFYGFVGLWDATVIDPSRWSIWIWVFPVVTLIFIAGLASSYGAPVFYERYWQQLFAFYVVATGSGFTIVTIASGPHYPVYNFVGILFCLFFCYSFIRLTFMWALAAGNLTVLIFMAASWFLVSPPKMILWSNFFYMFGVNLLGMMVCYALELLSRRDFMLNELLKTAEDKAKDVNAQLELMVMKRTEELTQSNRELNTAVKREKELVAQLKNEETMLQKSLNSLHQAETIGKMGYFEKDWVSGSEYWSHGFFKLLGYQKATRPAAPYDMMAFVHEEDRGRVTAHMQASLDNHESVDVEFRLVSEYGKVIQAHAVADNFFSHDGNPLMTRGVLQDITERKRTEEALKKLQGQLIQAQKMESIGRLAGGVAHDYNNISSIIVGYSELGLQEVEPGAPLYDYLTEINAAAKRSTDITRQLLAFARQQTISPKVLDLNDTIERMLKMLRRLIGEDIDLAWLPGAELWTVKIDPSQVDQILANLCVNARDAIANVGRVTIETRNVRLDRNDFEDQPDAVPGEYVLLAVSDDGSGMDPDLVEKIFEPFFTTKGLGKGTGLGLATVYGVVKQNNGFIHVSSEPQKGTTLRIFLPRHIGPARDAHREDTLQIPLGRGETVLLVEDDDAILKLGKKMLEDLGYDVLAAGSPREAVEQADGRNGRINLLITDVVMPEMNGRELSIALSTRYSELKTLYMSGYTANVIAHRGVLEDGVCFLSKPFSKFDLAVKVREALEPPHIEGR